MPWLALLPALLTAAALARGADELVVAAFAVPALLWLPGRGLARRFSRDPLERAVLAFWISALFAVPAVLVGMATGLGGPGTLATAATLTAVGERLAAPRAERLPRSAWVGAAAVVTAVLFVGVAWRGDIARPLHAYWWFPPAESAWEEGATTIPPSPGAGWSERRRVGWADAEALRLVARAPDPFLLGPSQGPLVLALQAPVGATLRVGDEEIVVQANVEEAEDEGPVPRYLDRGVAGLSLRRKLGPGERLSLRLSDPEHSVVYLLGSKDAVWALHAEGILRFTHYYQLLNMVEQIHWARELYADRRVTDVQPPLPSYVLAAPIATTNGALQTANAVFLLQLLMVGLAGVAAVRAWAPNAPWVASLLPAAAVVEHGKLLLEPGSAMLPDTLYTLGVLGTVTALARGGAAYTGYALLAQLCRYPGGFVAFLAGMLAGAPRRVASMLLAVVTTACAFAAAGHYAGSLDGWMSTVWWETFPEHWHGETDPGVLTSRAPRFYGLWLSYAGGLPLLAALRWPRGTRVLLGTAALYSLLLCTIDHTPSHYFLPLLHLAAVAAACTADAFENVTLRYAIPSLGIAGLSVAYAWVPVVG